MVVLASAGGNTVPAIARLVQAGEETIRQVIHRFNEIGMASLDPQWAGGRPRQISPDEEEFHRRDDQLWGVVRRRKSAANTLSALKSVRAACPDGAPIHVILDNLW